MMKLVKSRKYLKTGEANGSCDSAEVFVLLDRQRSDFLLAALYLVGQSALSTKNIEFTKEMFSTQSLDLKLYFPHDQLTEQWRRPAHAWRAWCWSYSLPPHWRGCKSDRFILFEIWYIDLFFLKIPSSFKNYSILSLGNFHTWSRSKVGVILEMSPWFITKKSATYEMKMVTMSMMVMMTVMLTVITYIPSLNMGGWLRLHPVDDCVQCCLVIIIIIVDFIAEPSDHNYDCDEYDDEKIC